MRFFSVIFCLSLALTATAADFSVLPANPDGTPHAAMMYKYLLHEAEGCLNARMEAYEALKTEADILAWQENLRSRFTESLGGFPERCPLNARITGQDEKEHFRYEKVIFESQPGLLVTAILYLPKGQGPWPGVIVPCGHAAEGKGMDAYQRASMLLAANGMAALCYDPIGQGERCTFLKEDGSVELGSVIDHTLVGAKAILTGMNTASFRVWDGMRAIDYLQSRDDIIADKIGCTGNSGGGTLTSYLMALDPRIVCAAPSCYLTSFDRLLNTIGPQDAEQNVFGQISYGLDHADYLHLHMPNPVLMCVATRDFFDINGTWSTFRQAKRLYTRLGVAERIDLIENDEEHGFHKAQREGMVRWMSRWLLQQDRFITEPDFDIFTEKEFLCTDRGQVIYEAGARSVLDLLSEREKMLAQKRTAFNRSADPSAIREKIKELIALRKSDTAAPEALVLKEDTYEGIPLQYLALNPEPGIVLPALLAMPEAFTGSWILICAAEGKASLFDNPERMQALLKEGNAVLALDLRGLGESANHEGGLGWHKTVGPDWQDFFLAFLLGRSYVGMRTEDILTAAHWLKAREDKAIRLVATGEATVPARHAAALEPDLFETLRLEGGIPSWAEVVHTTRAKHQLINTVHNALAWYDLPDLTALTQAQVEEISSTVPEF